MVTNLNGWFTKVAFNYLALDSRLQKRDAYLKKQQQISENEFNILTTIKKSKKKQNALDFQIKKNALKNTIKDSIKNFEMPNKRKYIQNIINENKLLENILNEEPYKNLSIKDLKNMQQKMIGVKKKYVKRLSTENSFWKQQIFRKGAYPLNTFLLGASFYAPKYLALGPFLIYQFVNLTILDIERGGDWYKKQNELNQKTEMNISDKINIPTSESYSKGIRNVAITTSAQLEKLPRMINTNDEENILHIFEAKNYYYITIKEIKEKNPKLIDILLGVEDRNFYFHNGIDPLNIARAAFVDLTHMYVKEGASGITNQVVKNLNLNPNITPLKKETLENFGRKTIENLISIGLEYSLTKDQILELYLNTCFFGNNSYGIAAALMNDFGITLEEATVKHMTSEITKLKAPTTYNMANVTNKQNIENHPGNKRLNLILKTLYDINVLSIEEYIYAKDEILEFKKNIVKPKAPQFTFEAYEQTNNIIIEKNTPLNAPITSITTLDNDLQESLESLVKNISQSTKTDSSLQIAGVTLGKNGNILALVGSKNYLENQTNYVNGPVFIGSTLKTFSVLYTFNESPSLATYSKVDDIPLSSSKYKIINTLNGKRHLKNHDNKFRGESSITIEHALSYSINAGIVNMFYKNLQGVDGNPDDEIIKSDEDLLLTKYFNFLGNLGIKSHLNLNNMSEDRYSDKGFLICIGGMQTGISLIEEAGAYLSLANGGVYKKPYYLEKIYTNGSKIIYEHEVDSNKVFDEEAARKVNKILETTLTSRRFYNGLDKKLKNEISYKTGTSDYGVSFVYYLPKNKELRKTDDDNDNLPVVTIVWAGYDPLKKVEISGSFLGPLMAKHANEVYLK
ncbi:penicillin-binding protein [Candidatus Woesearchaeota archaeon]|nr:penicillin-binding protein [Candidatus Woesearchaeota archaeon]MCF7900613.1 penicillin-binding protein [Candidatus Woesearchaeota archaeon]MCF8013897.1 penicillin-binding protein [Candidatus Woesearchaeota archaeon]